MQRSTEPSPKRRHFIRGLAMFVAAALSLGCASSTGLAQGAPSGPGPRSQSFAMSELSIRTGDGRVLPFTVELALTPAQQAQGLMWRQSLADDRGMLFINPSEREVSFWMMNTLIPLDMVFIDRTGRIMHIHENAIPHDTTPISSRFPVLAVLEVAGGLTRRLGIRPGDQVQHGVFRER